MEANLLIHSTSPFVFKRRAPLEAPDHSFQIVPWEKFAPLRLVTPPWGNALLFSSRRHEEVYDLWVQTNKLSNPKWWKGVDKQDDSTNGRLDLGIFLVKRYLIGC